MPLTVWLIIHYGITLVFTNILNYNYELLIGILLDPNLICKLYIFLYLIFIPRFFAEE